MELIDAKSGEKLIQGSKRWEALREKARTDLFWFNAKVLRHEELFPMTYRAHYALCRFAERRTGIPEIDSSRVQLIQVARGWGKSLNVTKGRTIQRLVTDRDWAAGIANERATNAQNFLGMIKAEFEGNEFLQWLFPECIPDIRQTTWKADEIIIARSEKGRSNRMNPSVYAAGVDTAVTGKHMNEWIVDDLISDEAAENARAGYFTEIEKANRWIVRLQPLLTRPKQDPLTFIGTPWWVDDCYSYIEALFGRKEEAREFLWRLKLPDGRAQLLRLHQKGEIAIFKMPARDEDGRAVYPEVFDEETLDKLREDDPVFFAAQYLLQPGADIAASFDPAWLKSYWWAGPHQLSFRDREGIVRFVRQRDLATVISVDPAISKKNGSAKSAVVVVGSSGAELFLLESWADRATPTELGAKILEFHERFRPSHIVIEKVGYQEALADVLELLAREKGVQGRLPIYEHQTSSEQRKEVRINGLEPWFRKGLFYIDPKTQHGFIEEYTHYPYAQLRDQLDALSFQKDLWERLSSREGDRGDPGNLGEWHSRQRVQADRIRERMAHRGRQRGASR